MEPHQSRRVGNGGGQVVHGGVPAGARRCMREAFDDGGPITPPRPAEPSRVQGAMGTRFL
jgi:hypothetical protein